MNHYLSVFLILFTANVLAQESVHTNLKGKVSAEMSDIEGIYVVNVNTEATVTTDKEGFFSIAAVVGDTLLFSAMQYKEFKLVLTCNHFDQDLLLVKMEPIMNLLNEVVVRRYDNINAVSLGIIPKGQKSYTAAERKLKTANSLDASGSIGGMAGGSVSADPLFNWISGRTAMLKKGVEVEKKNMYIKKLEKMFDENHFLNKLEIPAIYVKGFEYFVVENEKFTKILNSDNKTVIEFLLGELAVKYKNIIANE
jgi:hypothetical protein